MNLSIGIVGLPNVGKSTLFKILTKNPVNIANYPFCTIDPNIGVVVVKDERLDKLAKMSASKKIVPAVIEFYDIAGLVKGANEGAGLGNKFLSHIREVAAIVHVVRVFKDSNIIHVDNDVNPIRDVETIHTELILKDLDTITKHHDKVQKDARAGKKEAIQELVVIEKAKENLKNGKLLIEFHDNPFIKNLSLLTAKKQIYLLNGRPEDIDEDFKKKLAEYNFEYIVKDLSSADDLSELITKAYSILGLMSFFTTGENETRAWTILQGSKAPQAAGAIHTDFEKKFIKAEVINWEKLLQAGSWSKAKTQGWLRLEGKEYVFQEGDVAVFKHG